MEKLTPYKAALRWEILFQERAGGIPPQHGGILPSEMLLFVSQCLEHKVSHVIESGRSLGHSTEILAQFPDYWRVTSIEKTPEREADRRLRKYEHIRLLHGNGRSMMRDLLEAHPGAALLLDGPKGVIGLALYWKHRKEIALAGVHDLHRQGQWSDELRMAVDVLDVSVPGGSASRVFADRMPGAILSDGPAFVARFGYLDITALKYIGHTHTSLLPVASVLGIFPGGH